MTAINAISAPILTFMRQFAMKNKRTLWGDWSIKSGNLGRAVEEPAFNDPTVPIGRNATARVVRPVRTVRVVEAGQSRSNAGRMVISGRMADVCAELDRMVARESASARAHALPC